MVGAAHSAAGERRLATIWLAVCAGLGFAVGVGVLLAGGLDSVTRRYLIEQDLPGAVLGWLVLVSAAALAARLGRTQATLSTSSPRRLALALGAAAFVFAYGGVWLVFGRYALSGDELMAVFDTTIFGQGRTAAPVPVEWRPFVPALQPLFRLDAPGDAWWASAYLPVNAMLRAAFGRLRDPALAGPVWAGLSVLLVYAVGRRLRPEQPWVGATAAVLLATSSQLLITAMTPYAMSAHLALNLLWLLLVLRGGWGHWAAVPVALAATGLHQLVFHPLFAAPFVLSFWLQRRWGPALGHSLAYAAIGVFWLTYWSWALPSPPVAIGSSAGGVVSRAVELVLNFEPGDVYLTAANLLRFVVWQNPLTAPLLILSALALRRADSWIWALWAGLLGSAAAMAVLLPYQGQGWGFRYLHGLLGSACLLAALSWAHLADALTAPERRRAAAAFGLVAAAAFLILAPLRAWQVQQYVQPHRSASRAIAGAPVDFVLVDDSGVLFGADLVRNDPLLRNRPKVLLLDRLSPEQLSSLCGRGTVTVFGREQARGFGMITDAPQPGPDPAGRAARLKGSGCRLQPPPTSD